MIANIFMRVVLVSILLSSVSAIWPSHWIVPASCGLLAKEKYLFDNCSSHYAQECLCKSNAYLATVVQCMEDYGTRDLSKIGSGWNHFMKKTCKVTDLSKSHLLYDAAKNLTKESAIDYPETGNPTKVYHVPIKLPENQYRSAELSEIAFQKNKDISSVIGCGLVAFWIIYLIIAIFHKLYGDMVYRLTSPSYSMRKQSKLTIFWRKHYSMRALFHKHAQRLSILYFFDVAVPTRTESTIIFFYFALNIVFDLVPYPFHLNGEDILFPTLSKQTLRFLSDRAGIVGTIQMPLLVFFAMRNNSLLLRSAHWSYSKSNTFHRAIARVVYMQCTVHSVVKHVFSASYGNTYALMSQYFYKIPYYRYGVASMGLMALLLITASFRSKAYELFLRYHILGSIGAFVMLIKHLDGLGYKQPVYICCGLWCGEWLCRLIRILHINTMLFLEPVAGASRKSFALVYLYDDNVVNVKIRTPGNWNFAPGQYIFLSFGRVHFWEAHPFSLVGASGENDSIQVFTKARGGNTKRLADYLRKKGCGKTVPLMMSVTVEGPYGMQSPVERYSNVLLVSGGIGFTGVLPYVEYLCGTAGQNVLRIKYICAFQYASEIDKIERRLKALVATGRVQVEIYISRRDDPALASGHSNITMETLNEDEVSGNMRSTQWRRQSSIGAVPVPMTIRRRSSGIPATNPGVFENVTLRNAQAASMTSFNSASQYSSGFFNADVPLEGITLEKNIYYMERCNFFEQIRDFFISSNGSCCVLTCGPGGMADAVRDNVAINMSLCNGRVDYFEEVFLW